MLRNTLYYELKPFLPARFRTALRRWLVNQTLRTCSGVWPIKQTAGVPPVQWPGWPDGKQFALVLTHDVESSKGLERCAQLMQLEKTLGFRSAFYFIPEGDYTASKELRDSLIANQFEVGVHDLKHDGKLYRSREGFRASANRINHYLNEWGAVGFRSGFMHHHLDWMHDLRIQYDASTFDTDPFEPQPDGVDTIFPFWVPGGAPSQGYVELPYTLPQDFTMFILLEEENIHIWQKKLEWIVRKGGMALLLTHPDYMNFGDHPRAPSEYPAALYQQFLEHLKTKYEGLYWSVLPRNLAGYVRDCRLSRRRFSRKRVCMLAYTFYESDNRVMRYAESLVQEGNTVDVLALSSNPANAKHETLQGVNLIRVQPRTSNEKHKLSYLTRLLRFTLKASVVLAWMHIKGPYHLIHVHNVPDFLVFAAWLPKLTGAKVILDIHDIVPEFYASKFHTKVRSISFRLLRLIERLAAGFSDHVIVSNHLWHEKMIARSVAASKCSIILNHVDPKIFYPRPRTRNDGKFIILFPGGLQWHQGLDLAIRAFAIISRKLPGAEFHIYGEGNMKCDLVYLAKELGLENKVKFFNSVPIRQIAEVVANADLGVVPKRADSFGNEAYSTKIMEFMSQGVPVVASRTKIDTYYFNDRVVRFFESGNVNGMADAMWTVIRNKDLRESMISNGFDYVEENAWDKKRTEYLLLVDSLTMSC